jgi:hypothetical protein
MEENHSSDASLTDACPNRVPSLDQLRMLGGKLKDLQPRLTSLINHLESRIAEQDRAYAQAHRESLDPAKPGPTSLWNWPDPLQDNIERPIHIHIHFTKDLEPRQSNHEVNSRTQEEEKFEPEPVGDNYSPTIQDPYQPLWNPGPIPQSRPKPDGRQERVENLLKPVSELMEDIPQQGRR